MYYTIKEYNYKVITRRDIILKAYYIMKRRKSENYEKMYKYEQYKRCSRVTKRKLESRTGGVGKKIPDGLPLIHYAITAQL